MYIIKCDCLYYEGSEYIYGNMCETLTPDYNTAVKFETREEAQSIIDRYLGDMCRVEEIKCKQ